MNNQHRIEKPTATYVSIAIGNEDQLTEEQAAAVKEFIEQVGGVEQARRAIAALKELGKAA